LMLSYLIAKIHLRMYREVSCISRTFVS